MKWKLFFQKYRNLGWHALWLLILPVLGTWIAHALTRYVFLAHETTLALFQKGSLHYGYPFYLSVIPVLMLSVWILSYLRKTYLLFDLESTKFNFQILIFFSVFSYILTEYTLNSLFTESKWWLDNNYRAFNSSIAGASTIFAIAHSLWVFYMLIALRFLSWLSFLDPHFKVLKTFWKKPEWSESEFVRIIRILYRKEYEMEDFIRHRDEFLSQHNAPFSKQNLKDFELGWQKIQAQSFDEYIA
ncbi:MAG: hypothetical protein JJT94_00935 [Bernardetiaceae bacterium]|nr:hypothetical protein [Bernardetiaceae bacterium]